MKEIVTYGKIENGRLLYFNEAFYRQKIYDARNASDVKITLEYGNKRTVNQNAYLWGGVIDPIVHWLKSDGWKHITPGKFYREIEKIYSVEETVNQNTGDVREMVVPLKEQDTEKFWDIVEQVVKWGHKKGIDIQWPWEFYGMTEMEYINMKFGNAA